MWTKQINNRWCNKGSKDIDPFLYTSKGLQTYNKQKRTHALDKRSCTSLSNQSNLSTLVCLKISTKPTVSRQC